MPDTPTVDQEPIEVEQREVLDVTSLGGGLRLVDDRKVSFSKPHCEKILALTPVPGDRKLSKKKVSDHVLAMQRGTFLSEQATHVICKNLEDEVEYRANGQHTSQARLLMPDDWDGGQIRVLRYEAQNMQDVRRLYASIDRGKSRTRADVINAYMAGVEGFEEYSSTMIKTLSEGLSFYLFPGHERKTHDGDDISYLMQTDYFDLSRQVADFLNQEPDIFSAKCKFLRRAPVIGSMFATFQVDPSASIKFWGGVRDGTNITSQEDPKLRLREQLLNSVLIGGTTRNPKRLRITPSDEMYTWAVRAWNAWRKGEGVKYLRATAGAERPIAK